MRTLKFDAVLTKAGWIEAGHVTIDARGEVLAVAQKPPTGSAVETFEGYAIPGFQNAHSHAFQYAMAGLAEHLPKAAAADDFWSWRDAMYKLAMKIGPDQMEAVAARLYAEMLRHGITAVAEFHYLHHGENGRQFQNPAEMGERLMAAAATAGIHLTLLPVLYQQGGFGQPATPAQARFLSRNLEDYGRIVEATRKAAAARADVTVGIAVHSLRAVAEADARTLLAGAFEGPAHIHVAEQRKEVTDCVTHLGKRPVAWLLDNVALDQRYSLVHATHMDESETTRLAKTGATVVVCPSTEGNLGDGFFPLEAWRAAGGACAFGTDSHVGLSPLEELRWLDYGQRLRSERRNVLCREGGEDSGTLAFDEAWTRGRLAMGLPAEDYFAPHAAFDAVILDPEHPALYGKPAARRLSALLYAGDPSCFLGTMRRGRWVVRAQRHDREKELRLPFMAAMSRLAT